MGFMSEIRLRIVRRYTYCFRCCILDATCRAGNENLFLLCGVFLHRNRFTSILDMYFFTSGSLCSSLCQFDHCWIPTRARNLSQHPQAILVDIAVIAVVEEVAGLPDFEALAAQEIFRFALEHRTLGGTEP